MSDPVLTLVRSPSTRWVPTKLCHTLNSFGWSEVGDKDNQANDPHMAMAFTVAMANESKRYRLALSPQTAYEMASAILRHPIFGALKRLNETGD